MKALQTNLKDCWVIEPDVFEDERGYFYEGFNSVKFKEEIGIDFHVKQLNQSRSSKGVLRGLHFQHAPKSQAKLVTCTEGEILDVAVDIRPDSATFKQHFIIRLSAENKKSLYIPKGFAHGFLVLSEHAKLMYQVDEVYDHELDDGIAYNDPALNIPWGLSEDKVILSKKDAQLKVLSEIKLSF